MARLINITDATSYGRVYELNQEPTLIGAYKPSNLVLPLLDSSLFSFKPSRLHSVIFYDDGSYYLGDCSTYGTWYPIDESEIFAVSSNNKLNNMIASDIFKRNKSRFGRVSLVENIEQVSTISPEIQKYDMSKDREYLIHMIKEHEIKQEFICTDIVKLLENNSIFGIVPYYRFRFEA